ncbi:MAG TPA: fused MFS/spermidine synthase, partial [Gemmatimonadaceae bacterium]
FVRRPLRLALGVLAVLMAGLTGRASGRPPLLAVRSFFGVYGVRDVGEGFHVLYNGTTLHGAQNRRPGRTREPLTYYRVRGPLGDLFSVKRLARRPLRVGVVGLGAGSVACYAQPGDRWTFYEIDPMIERIARDTRYFSYLSECTPDARVVLGDARLSLAHADPATRYDVLVLDAFSSDAIPVHLLTREALEVYRAHLAPGGIIAVHVSNRYLDLRPVVGNLAADAGMTALLGEERRLDDAARARLHTASIWVALADSPAPLEALGIRRPRWSALAWDTGTGLWTDDFSNVLGVLSR